MYKYFYNLGTACSILVNAVCDGPTGYTSCATLYEKSFPTPTNKRWKAFKLAYLLVDRLTRNPAHCRAAWLTYSRKNK